MLMVGALSVIEQHSPVQLFVGLLICLGYLLIVLRAAPYEDESLDRLSFFASLSLVLTLLLWVNLLFFKVIFAPANPWAPS